MIDGAGAGGPALRLQQIGRLQPWTIKKGAVWWIRRRNREDTAQVILQAVQAPDLL